MLAGGGSSGSITNSALSVARGVQYGAIALGLGALIFFLACWRPLRVASRAFTARLERMLLVAAVAGLVSALVAIVLQGAVGRAARSGPLPSPDTVARCSNTRFGTRVGHRRARVGGGADRAGARPLRGASAPPPEAPEPVLVVAGGGAAPAPAPVTAPRRRAGALDAKLAALAVPLFGLALLPSLGGHTSVQQPVAVLLPANIVHVLAMSAWLGGIAVLVFALRAATSSWSRTHGRRCWPAPSGASRRWRRSRCRW